MLLIAGLGATLIVLAGPTDFGIVRDRVAAIIRKSLGAGYDVGVGRAVVDIDPVLGLVVRVDNIDVRDSTKDVVAHIPSTRFAIDPFALLRLRVEVKQVELSGPEISFARGGGGSIYLGNADTPAPAKAAAPPPTLSPAEIDAADGGFPDLLAALYIMDRGIEPQMEAAIDAGFERFGVVNGTISLSTNGQERRFPGTDLNVALDKTTSALNVTLATSGYGGRWTATIERDLDASSGSHMMSAVFSQLTIADIFPSLGDDDGLLTADIPLYGRANIRFDKNGAVQDANARLDFGAGVIRFGEDRDSVLLDEATVKVHWDVASRQMILDPSTFYFGQTRGVVTGRIFPEGDAADRRYGFEIESPGAVLAPEDSGEPPIISQRIAVNGVADMKAKVINVENAVIQAQDSAVAAAGSLGFSGVTPSLAMAATFSPMDASVLKQMWVPLIAPGARRWVLKNVGSGRLVSGRFEAAIPPGVLWTGKRPVLPDDALRLNMQFADASFTTFGKLPPIVNASGNVVVSGSTVGIDLEKGEVKVPSGVVTVDNGAFAVPNTSKRPADGLIEVQLSGSAAALAEVADSDPLRALARREMVPADLSGNGTANVSVRLPLRDGITDADVDWKVVVKTNDVASKKPFEGRTVSAADVAITVTPDDVAIYGRAKIDGVGADVSMSFPIGNGNADNTPGDRRVRLLLDEEARKRFGVGLDEVLSGTISALVSDAADGVGQHYDLDLRRARVILPGIGWTKGIGVPATLAFDVKPANEGYSVQNLVLSGDGFGFAGSAKLDETYNLQSADITRMSLHPGDSVSLKLTRGKSGYALTVRGDSFDLRGMMEHVRDKNDQSGGFPDLALDARIDRLIGFNQEEVDNASLTLVSVGGETQKVAFAGKLGGDDIALNFAVQPNGTTLQANADDAGRLLRFTNAYTHVEGGSVVLTGKAARTGPLLGTLEISGFDVTNEPALTRVIASDPSQTLGTRRVHFDHMVARFRRTDHVIAVEDALLSGDAVGATFSGRYDLSGAQVDIAGTYIPAYALNNFFSKIPIIGLALGGGSGEGLFGVTFRIAGPISQPEVFFNPLSAVAPGIFRKIFEFQRPTQ
ncbi:MAG TPA: AsmA-like C-terminal region-containing protein [Bauldia sp.]|nr:AsmA-like C-terminal region-containing protein [Bauldia sp.]